VSAPTDPLSPGEPDGPAQQLAFVRTEAGIEIGLLHERVNALLAAEAFLTIAYTAAMSNGTAWGETFAVVVAPILAVLGLLLALLAWPGIDGTVRMVLDWTARQQYLLDEHPVLVGSVRGLAARGGGRGRAYSDQRRGMLFFRAVPILFALVWAAFTVVALVVPH
jgi:hypothetical protein